MLTLDRDTHLERLQQTEELLQTITGAQLVSVARTATTPWLALLLSEMRKVQTAGQEIPGVGDFRITEQTVDCAGRVIGSIRHRWLPIPMLGTVAGGGLVISWGTGAREIELIVFPSDRVLVSQLEAGELASTRELSPNEYGDLNKDLSCLLN